MAVCPANNDIANADALKLARKVDPVGERTIGVLTKIDLMDDGTNALDIIRGKVYPLKLGFVPVICRSQKDSMDGKDIQECLRDEERFFKMNQFYRAMASRCGVPFLCRSLSEVIVKCIKNCLPLIRSKITSLLCQKEKELKAIEVQRGAGS
jgi:dynamin 1-like protein